MKKDVKISIAGLHENGGTDSLEVISFGEMYEENGETIVKYEEAMEDAQGRDCEMVQSQLKIREDQIEIMKEGGTRTHMVFAKDQDMLTYYSTPFGELEIVIHTDRLEQKKLDNGFHVELEYALEVNAAHMSNCNVRIKVEEME
ncbi:MAG: DUF1934 domain-containing protein [Eubacterium sp.]